MTVWSANPVAPQYITRQEYETQLMRQIQYQRYYEQQRLLRYPNSVISAVSPPFPGFRRLRRATAPSRWHPSEPIGARIPEEHH